MMAKTKRNILYAVLLTVLALFCGYKIIMRIKEYNEQKARLDMASENAAGYVREKYGFEPEILDTSDDEFPKTLNTYYDDVRILKMKADGREFYVLASCLEGNSYCVDDYQREEIKTAANNEILKNLPDGSSINISWAGTEDMTQSMLKLSCFFNTYFDGGNIDEFMEKGDGKIEMVFSDVNISESDIPDKLEKINVDYLLISFDTAERLEEYTASGVSYRMYAPYITDHIASYYKNGEKNRISYKAKDLDNFKYCCFPESNSNISLNEVKQSEFINRRDPYGKLECLKQPLSKAYKLRSAVNANLHIYYPLDKLNGMDVKQIGAVWQIDNGELVGTEKAEICGDYAVFVIPGRTSEFMLVDLREQP